jgi:drug/metabolite transporter (DMT)-like permease
VNSTNRSFKYKVMIPGLADLLITGMRYVAILYVAPAVVSILKSSSQLLVLSIIQHCRGKRLTAFLVMCLLGAFAGEVVVTSAGFLGGVPGIDPVGPPWIGVALAFASGSLGAVRNVMEEALLQGDNLSAGGLLMAESWISLIGTVLANVVWESSRGNLQEFFREVWAVCAIGTVWPLLITLMLCTYGKDFGKLFVTKYGDALTAKILSLLFPIVTWLLDIVTFVATSGQFGEGLDPVASPVQLVGFALVAGSCIAFVIRQKRPRR